MTNQNTQKTESIGVTEMQEIKQNADNANLILRNLCDNSLSTMSASQIRAEIKNAQSLLRRCK